MFLLLLILFLSEISAFDCPFHENDSDSCYSDWYDDIDHTAAYARCAFFNAFMFDINNAFENSEVQTRAEGRQKIWLGLSCLNSSISSCEWDNGRKLNADSYTNFVGGKPAPINGACVYMSVSNGLWYNCPCTTQTASAQCQINPDVDLTVPYCTDGSLYFRGNCYLGSVLNNETQGHPMCFFGCGVIVSIHSDAENAVVTELASVNQQIKYGFLGFTENKWDDSSHFDYNHFGHEDQKIGSCALISLKDDVVKKGYWISYPCYSSSVVSTVCKKPVINKCDPPHLKQKCDETTFLKSFGQFSSPGYPNPSGATSCEFVLTIEAPDNNSRRGIKLALNFLHISLDANSYIYIYDSIFTDAPFITLTNTNSNLTTIFAPGTMMKIVFNTAGTNENYFRAYFGEGRIPCTNGTYYDSGNFITPNYPNPSHEMPPECEVRFLSSKNSIGMLFKKVNLEEPASIYDGAGNKFHDFKSATNYTVAAVNPVLRLYMTSDTRQGISASYFSI